MSTALMYAIRVVQQVRIKNLENAYLKNDSLPKKLLPVKIKTKNYSVQYIPDKHHVHLMFDIFGIHSLTL